MDKMFEELNLKAVEWYEAKNVNGNEALAKKLLNDICIDLYTMQEFKKYQNEISTFFMYMHNFNPEKADFVTFAKFKMGKIAKTAFRKDKDMQTIKDENGEKKLIQHKRLDSYDESDETSIAFSNIVSDKKSQKAYDKIDNEVESVVIELVSIILNMNDRLYGKQNNEKRKNYIKIFFTDYMSSYLKSKDTVDVYIKHERDVINSILLDFLNFFTIQNCETVKQIQMSDVKKYGDIVLGRDMKPVKQPLPNDVLIQYFEQMKNLSVSSAAISQQKGFFHEFMKDNLKIEI